jgi:DNA-binding transcriptional regulator YdaS (Cro superfamily)
METFDREWELIKAYGVGKLARALGRSRQTLRRWKGERHVPARLLSQIEELTGARRENLSPELYDGLKRIRK